VEDHLLTITAPNLDFGDFSGFAQATSVANTTIKLGVNAADAEASLTGTTSANADDTTGTDDEDGVTQTTLRAGQSGTITVNVTNTSGAAAYLNVWADWNQNNVADTGEQLATNTAIATGTSNSNIGLSVTPPIATATGTIPLRARITNIATPGLGNTFPGTSLGEVEDHLITITAPNLDFGDFSGFAQATSVANATIKMGVNAADAEVTLTGNTSANVDDTTVTDDEDGVTQTALRASQSGTITVNVTNTSGAAAYLNVWADWNKNNLADAGEQIATNTAIATGTSNSNIALTVNVPSTVATGTVPLRARITNVTNPGFSNTFPGTSSGEVEDHLLTISGPNQDFGDFSGFAQATSVANATIKLGTNAADAELTLTGNTSANADDTTGTDDEDGVTQTTLRAGQSGTITVNVTNTSGATAYLNVWADWNKNNLADAGEQIATNQGIATGTSNSNLALTVTPPITTATGTIPLRARMTNVSNPGFSNTFPGTSLGEVEDHLITITAPNLDFGDYSGFAQATSVANTTIKLGVNAADVEVTLIGNTSSANADDTTGVPMTKTALTQTTLRARPKRNDHGQCDQHQWSSGLPERVGRLEQKQPRGRRRANRHQHR
jgi:DNA gyrase inhibitor GyrI